MIPPAIACPHGYALLGSLEEARAAVRAGLALDPTFTLRRLRGRMSDESQPEAALYIQPPTLETSVAVQITANAG